MESGCSDPPSSVQSSDIRKQSCLFDLDSKFATEPGFICYDFQRPEDIPSHVHHAFDCVIIDPPFITEEVWRLYAAASKLLLAPSGGHFAWRLAAASSERSLTLTCAILTSPITVAGPDHGVICAHRQVDVASMCAGKIIATTIAENAALLKDLLGVSPQPYKPCIPHLVSALLKWMLCCVLHLTRPLCICRYSSMTCTPITAAHASPNRMMRLLLNKSLASVDHLKSMTFKLTAKPRCDFPMPAVFVNTQFLDRYEPSQSLEGEFPKLPVLPRCLPGNQAKLHAELLGAPAEDQVSNNPTEQLIVDGSAQRLLCSSNEKQACQSPESAQQARRGFQEAEEARAQEPSDACSQMLPAERAVPTRKRKENDELLDGESISWLPKAGTWAECLPAPSRVPHVIITAEAGGCQAGLVQPDRFGKRRKQHPELHPQGLQEQQQRAVAPSRTESAGAACSNCDHAAGRGRCSAAMLSLWQHCHASSWLHSKAAPRQLPETSSC